MKTIATSKPTRHAAGFRSINDGGAYRVVWLDQIDGEPVSARDKVATTNPKQTRERIRRLEKMARDQEPRVVWVESKNSYQLHVKIDGRTQRVGLSEKDYDLAVQKVPRKMIEMGWSEDLEARATLSQVLGNYLAKRAHRPSAKSRESCVSNFLRFFTGDKSVASFTRADQTEWENHRADCKRSTINADIRVFNAAMAQAVKDGLISAVPVKWEAAAEPEIDRLVISKGDWALISETAATLYDGSNNTGRLSDLEIYLHMVRVTGGRKSFYQDLRWDRVDFERGVINFAVVGESYTTKRRPLVPISADLLPTLQRAFDERDGSELVLWQQRDMANMMRTLRLAMSRSNNDRLRELSPVIHSHAFRRSFVTWCVSQGFSPWVIGKITGSSAQIIEKNYAVFRPDHALDLVNKV